LISIIFKSSNTYPPFAKLTSPHLKVAAVNYGKNGLWPL